ncbi:CLUMA_CG003141, isoform A [Clunio marinus]|uniref:CLUMA_CG003141, isoform A n=1 Tax=Clunio marinus TaxID=568069 RepID=A0A1J1HN56_9DIPT|nr:CLUMA_CG003141, isoform A [Clunio marinus]
MKFVIELMDGFYLIRSVKNELWEAQEMNDQQQIQHNDASFINNNANESDKQSSVSCIEIHNTYE